MLSFLLGSGYHQVAAQQEDAFSQFMHLRQLVNPGQTGSSPGIQLTALIRNQWIGLAGSPKWQTFLFSMPLMNNRVGVGANIYRHTIGITQMGGLDGSYAYRFRVPKGFLSFGLQSSVRYLQQDFSLVRGTHPIEQDESVPLGLQSKFVPNFGAGVYFEAEKGYVGFSVPRFLRANIDFSEKGQLITREVQHYYLLAGVTLPLSASWSILPQTLWRYVPNAPFDADFHVSMLYQNRISGGFNYRIGSSTGSVIAGLQMGQHLYLGMAYEISFSDLQQYYQGTAELLLRYAFAPRKVAEAEAITPRVD